jgi:hypothetical protein
VELIGNNLHQKISMGKEEEIQELAAHFRALGAEDPEGWARSQVNEGIPQYARFVFLRQAWKNVIADGNTSWIDAQIAEAEKRPRDPGAGAGPALKRMLDAGVKREDIAEVARVMQWELLSGIAYQLDNSGDVDYPNKNMPMVNWALFETNEAGEPSGQIPGLHESVLDTDPSGREMRPKGVTRAG